MLLTQIINACISICNHVGALCGRSYLFSGSLETKPHVISHKFVHILLTAMSVNTTYYTNRITTQKYAVYAKGVNNDSLKVLKGLVAQLCKCQSKVEKEKHVHNKEEGCTAKRRECLIEKQNV